MERITTAVVFAAGAIAMFAAGRCSSGAPAVAETPSERVEPAVESVWTCPMHPQVRKPENVPCPICEMDLVPLEGTGDDGGEDERELRLSESARRLARIATVSVERRGAARTVRLAGKIDFDESTIRTISARVPGRLDRLFVDYTGVRVEEGDHLVSLYSPDLLTAQEELLAARDRLGASLGSESSFLAESNCRTYETAREKLLLWGLTLEQVDAIETRGTVEDHMLITSHGTGVVIEKLLDEGAYVETGTHIYRIADLSQVWVLLDAYERDLAWLRYGQTLTLEADALPGEVIVGSIAFIDPAVDERTRTAKVRVNVENADGRLKPGMFVRANVTAELDASGRVIEDSLAGKWMSPMHPEVFKDGPGSCDVCGMALVPAEQLMGVRNQDVGLPMVVPATAVLTTGRRAVVYVEKRRGEDPVYAGREVVLGPRAGDDYVVLSGLDEGERVVVNGAFRLDASMQILAKPSMMSPSGEDRERGWGEGPR